MNDSEKDTGKNAGKEWGKDWGKGLGIGLGKGLGKGLGAGLWKGLGKGHGKRSHDRAIPTPRVAKSHSPGNGIARALKPHATSVIGNGKAGLLTPGSGKLDPANGSGVTCVPRKSESVLGDCQHFGVRSTGKG